MLDTSEPGPDRDALEQKLHGTTTRFDAVKDHTSDRQERLDKVVPLSRKHKYESQTFKPWLSSAEKRLAGIDPETCDKSTLDKHMKTLKDLDDEVEDRKPDLQELNDTTADLVESCQADKFIIEGDAQDVNKRYDNLADGVDKLKKKVEEVKDAVEKYEDSVVPVEKALEEIEKAIAAHEPVGIDLEKGKSDQKEIDDLFEKLEDLKSEVDKAKGAGDELVDALGDKSPKAAEVKDNVDALADKYKDLKAKLNDHKKKVDEEIKMAEKFNDALQDLEEKLPDIQEAVAAQEAISSDPDVVKKQLQDSEVRYSSCSNPSDRFI